MDAVEYIKNVKEGKIDVEKHIKEVIEKLKAINEEHHFFTVISEELALKQAKNFNKDGKLAGLPVSIKDCICVEGVETTASSRILKGYKPLFNATAVQRVIDEGGIIIGKTMQDEFGFGSFSINVGKDYKSPLHPIDKKRVCGGSSGGSGGITKKADFAHISLGESTGGSIEAPASFCGIIGFCPTYGRVSRYGLLDYGNSLDKIGPMCKTIREAALMLDVISGYDQKDSTSLDAEKEDFTSYLDKEVKGMKIGIIKEAFGEGVDKEVKNYVWSKVKELETKGVEYEEVSLPTVAKYGVQTYYILAMSEASTNLAKYCGMRYGNHEELNGNFNEYFSKVRQLHFGKEAKRRIMIGTFARMSGYRDAYYLKAAKVRTKIINEYKKMFEKYDLLITPTMPFTAPIREDVSKMSPLQHYMADIMTVGPNLAGIPHASIPIGKDSAEMPIGMMLLADHMNEGKIIQLAKELTRKS